MKARAVGGTALAVLVLAASPSTADSIWLSAQLHGVLGGRGGLVPNDSFYDNDLDATDTSMPVGAAAEAGWLHADQVGLFGASEVFFFPLRDEPGAIPAVVLHAGMFFVFRSTPGFRTGLSVSAGQVSVDSRYRGRDVRGADLFTQMRLTFAKPLPWGSALEGHLALQQGAVPGISVGGLLFGFGLRKGWTV